LLTTFLFYYNSVSNDFALDDALVLTNNELVHQGIRGIPDIVSHDVFYGATRSESKQLSWRYRPMSLISYAVEYTIFKENASGYHFMNLLYYALLGVVLYRFLFKWIFPARAFASFLTTMIFIASPVHPEVVANIKSRDEIFALLFLILHIDAALKYMTQRKTSALLTASLFLLLALMSKEINVIALAMTPVLWFVLNRESVRTALLKSIPFLLIGALFILMRVWISPIPKDQNNIMSDPYFLAVGWQKLATIVFVLLKYMQLMIWPDNLIFDYGFNHIAYYSFSDPVVMISFLLHLSLLAWATIGCFRRESAAMFMLFYLGGIFLLSNALLKVGPPLAERFLFTPGLFFILAMAILLDNLIRKKIEEKYKKPLLAFTLVYLGLCFSIVRARNFEWKNNATLYFADVKKAPNSFRIQAFCGMTLLSGVDEISDSTERVQMIRDAIGYFQKAYSIYPDYGPMYQDWGSCYQRLGNIDSTEWAWSRSKQLLPDSRFHQQNEEMLSTMKYNACVAEYQRVKGSMNIPQLLEIQRRCVLYKPDLAASWLLLGKLYFVNRQSDSALICWKKSFQLDPAEEEAKQLLNQYGR
jgi:hypothetical protein